MTSNERADHADPTGASAGTELWALRLYVAGRTTKDLKAFANLTRMCEATLRGRYEIEVVDLLDRPELAIADQILALPTVVRMTPMPVRRVIGDLSDTGRVLAGLGIERRHAR
jgi:circadian clock protein KaiB